jgi:uncharacterized membrane protein YhiD involved in acid resistance
MLDLLNTNGSGHQTSIILIVFSLALTFLLSLILVLTYEKTSRQVSRPDHFIQSLLLMSIVTSTIMQSIGDSLALSFGIFGALAIIRFRTRISDPRDVAFIFATMAVGIACGVHSFLNGIIGTAAFCIIVIILRYSPFGQKSNLIGELKIELPKENSTKVVTDVLDNYKVNYSLKRVRAIVLEENKNFEYEYKVKLEAFKDLQSLTNDLIAIPDGKLLRFVFNDENDIDAI